MPRSVLALCIFVVTASGLLYIERYESQSSDVVSLTINYTHDSKGNSITNETLVTSATITKMLLYITIRAAEDENDKEYKKTIVKSVFNVEKAFKSLHSDFFVKSFFAGIVEHMDFEFKFPMPPVSRYSNL